MVDATAAAFPLNYGDGEQPANDSDTGRMTMRVKGGGKVAAEVVVSRRQLPRQQCRGRRGVEKSTEILFGQVEAEYI